ncbi:MAG: 16S rRNA (guanine(966)-N(2))-methyltransferase RsmD [PVC group bacterium]|nr:16S rRNA (guanine(966)-N(2))-methyltransferase RsmD [PVC group bacterium]
MRITSGTFKGRILKQPKSKDVRPTTEKVRKAIFDVLSDFIVDKQVLDLFSGSGALGCEALSRGASGVTFIEKKRECVKVIKDNLSILNADKKYKIIEKDVLSAFKILQKKGLKFSVIIADPPYYGGLAKKCLLEICNYDILNPPTIIIIEHYKKDELPEQVGNYALWQLKKYGDTFVSFFK